MKLTRGGKSLTPEVRFSDAPPERVEPLTASLFDSMVDMQQYRYLASTYWFRYIKLVAKIDKDPKHPNAMRAEMRAEMLKALVREHQWRFLALEEDANMRWGQLSPPQRKEGAIDEMFGVPSDQPHILGLWHRAIGSQPGSQSPIDPMMFKIISPAHAKAYEGRASWHNPDDENLPDAAIRKRKGSSSRSTTQ